MPKKSNGILTDKERVFVAEYLVNGYNASKAARDAGYAHTTAEKKAPTWVAKSRVASTKPHIWDAVQAQVQKRTSKLEITYDRVMEEYARLAFSDIAQLYDANGNLLPIHQMPEDARRAILEVNTEQRTLGRGEDAEPIEITKVKISSKQAALDSICKVKGFIAPEKHVHSGTLNVRDIAEIDRATLLEILGADGD